MIIYHQSFSIPPSAISPASPSQSDFPNGVRRLGPTLPQLQKMKWGEVIKNQETPGTVWDDAAEMLEKPIVIWPGKLQ